MHKAIGKGIVHKRYRVFAALLPALLAITACSRSNVQAAPAMPSPLVTVVKATAQDVPKYLDEIGRNAAFEAVTVTPQVGGRITERHFQDGENLSKGQLLFVIDPRPFQAQVDAAEATLAQAKAALDLANIQFARDQEVIGTRAISKQDWDTKKNTVDVDQAQVEAAQAALETAKLNLEYCYIHSPIDGRAGARLVDVGNVVMANSTSLLSIQRINPIYANFHHHGERSPGCAEADGGGNAEGGRPASYRPGELSAHRPRGISRQLGAEWQRHGESARHVEQPGSPLLARAICRCEASPGNRERRRADSQPSGTDQPKGTVCLRGEG